MAKAVKIDISTRETIKPSSPTPQHLKYIKLSLLDQLNFAMSTPLLLFYPLKCDKNKNLVQHAVKEQSQLLKSSLSKTLTLFYPLASNKLIKNNSCIECNDYGIEFIETKVNCSMLDLFQEPNNNVLEKLIPIDLNLEKFTGAIIQANFFDCGGFAIGISLSHKIADAASLGTFLMAWSATCLSMEYIELYGSGETWTYKAMLPYFISDTIIPSPEDSLVLPPPPPPPPIMTKCITRRYVFYSSKISLLKTKIATANIQQPTRVEAVTSLLWKSLISVSRLKSRGYSRKSVLIQAVNLRKRFIPPLSQNYIGNLSGKFLVTTKEEDNIELSHLVTYLREGLNKVSDHVSKGVNQAMKMEEILEFAKEFGELHSRDDIDLYSFTSLCGFPFYEVDFGWGKPIWTIVTNLVLKNYVVLIDTKDEKGVEVWMSLSEEDVPLLEANQELLAFASINPSVN